MGGVTVNVKKPELLAPAGDYDSLRAAVANGADAVYFGMSRFSARQRAANFSLEELGDTIAYLHGHNVRGYVAFNTLVFSGEMDHAARCVEAIANAGADAVIVQDLGLVRLIRRMVPSLSVHASTQTTQTETLGIELLRSLGVSRVILARELTLEQIAALAKSTNAELEVFVHGALCVSYSGQCLASEALWARSANRGLCAQACRLPYKLVADGTEVNLGDRMYLVSMPDLAAWDRIGDLARAGVASVKIEGRLKSAEYVAAATRVYRAAIDAWAAGKQFELSTRNRQELTQSFSRGFTHGFLDGANHQETVPGVVARHLGVRVGRVAGSTRQGVLVELDRGGEVGIKPGDGVVFDDGRAQQDQQGGRVYAVDPYRAGQGQRGFHRLVEVKFRAGEVDGAALPAEAVVWRTDDPGLRRELKKTFARDQLARRVGLHVTVRASAGEALRIEVRDDQGNTARAQWPGPLEASQKHPLTKKLLVEQFGRLGQTPFELAGLELLGPTGTANSLDVMVPKSVMNDLRRQVVEQLLSHRRSETSYPIVEPTSLDNLRREAMAVGASRPQETDARRLSVLVRTMEQLQAVLDWRSANSLSAPATVYCDFADIGLYSNAMKAGQSAGVPIGLATPRVLKQEEERVLRQIADCAPSAVLARSLGAVRFFRRFEAGLPLVGDASLNVANELTAALLAEWGLERITPCVDLNFDQLAELLSRFSPARFEMVIHQHVAMMHMEHCVFAAGLSRGRDRTTCGQPCRRYKVELRDRKSEDHPLFADAVCGNTLFNAHAQSGAQFVQRMIQRGVRHFRVEFLREASQHVAPMLDCYARLLAGLADGEETWRRIGSLCPARITRGTLDQEDGVSM